MYQVIIVEDDPMVAEIDKQYVEHNSHSLAVAGVFHNGQDALDFIRSTPVDLILLDYYMPVMDGRTFLRQPARPATSVSCTPTGYQTISSNPLTTAASKPRCSGSSPGGTPFQLGGSSTRRSWTGSSPRTYSAGCG